MKALIGTLNSKYIHTSISIRYLQNYFNENFAKEYKNISVDNFESTINSNLDSVINDIVSEKYDVVALSCYIWNIEYIEKVIDTIKKVSSNIKIVLGGPEVSYDSKEYMKHNQNIDFILTGEGEESFSELLIAIYKKDGYERIKGLSYRNEFDVISNSCDNYYMDMDKIPFPYNDFVGFENKILYYESSRGCPFNCKYCLSEREKKLRFRSLDIIKKDLLRFIENRVLQVKFVDRTFNADKKHAMEIIKFIVDNDNGYTNFHFEITASLINDEMIEILNAIRPELIQFEIGVQSTNLKTLEAIDRKVSFEKIKEMCLKIKKGKNIHIHLDLIAGLPYANMNSFMNSMNDLFEIRPEKVQLGFLKVLKGSSMYNSTEEFGIVYRTYPPYEVLKTNWMSYDELSELKMVEEIIDYYYNSMKFENSMEFIVKIHKIKYAELFFEIKNYWLKNNLFSEKHSQENFYEILYEFCKSIKLDKLEVIKELLKLDYLSFNRKKSGDFFRIEYEQEFRDQCHEFLKDQDNLERYLPQYVGMAAKNIIKQVHFEPFSLDIIDIIEEKYDKIITRDIIVLFDYSSNNKIFEKKKYYKIFQGV